MLLREYVEKLRILRDCLDKIKDAKREGLCKLHI